MTSDAFPEGFAFWSGFAMGLLGLLALLATDIHQQLGAGGAVHFVWIRQAVTAVGAVAVVGGPGWYWVVRPSVLWWDQRDAP